MANEMDTALKSAATSVAQYVRDACIMMVETKFVEIDRGATDFGTAQAVARTVIKLDGDSESVLPMRRNEMGVLEVDATLFNLHQQNVHTAIEYRTRILNALLGTLVNARTAG